jgi:hypothetical protein
MVLPTFKEYVNIKIFILFVKEEITVKYWSWFSTPRRADSMICESLQVAVCRLGQICDAHSVSHLQA